MNNSIILKLWVLCTVCLTALSVNAQVPTDQDCDGAIAVCQNVYNQTTSYSGTGNYPSEINSGNSCLGGAGEVNSVWYTFTVQTNGNVCFTITPSNSGDDYDWAVYDVSADPCSAIYGGGLEVSCNFSGVSGPTGPNGGTGAQEEPCIAVTAGQTYAISVQNWSGTTGGYTLDFSASSATIFDNVAPGAGTVTAPACGSSTIDIDFSENVLCNTVAACDFSLTGPGGPYTVTAVTGAVCAAGGQQENAYTVTVSPALNSDGAYSLCLTAACGGVEDLCGNTATTGCWNFNISGCSVCDITSMPITLSNCYVDGGGFLVYDVDGVINYTDPPTTGTLTITACDGQTVVFNAPFGTSQNFSFTGLPQGAGNCNFDAVFSDDAGCTFTQGFMSPPPILGFSSNCVVGGGAVNGDITFDDTYTSGTLIISADDGTSVIDTIINLPATSPQNWSISGLDPAANPYTITYYFSDYPSCSQSLTMNCGCSADAGTVTTTLTGNGTNSFVLCDGDQIEIATNNDYVDPDDIGPIGTAPSYPFQPALLYVVYSCPPTPGIWPPNDPCFVGLLPVEDIMTDVNNGGSWADVLPGGPYTDLWFAQTNVYYWDGTTAVWNSNCWDVGPGIQVTYLNPIATPAVPDCQDSSVTVTLTGGYPEVFGGNYTASNLTSTSGAATFVNTTTTHGGTIVINNLQDGDMWSFDIVDGNGCPITVSGGPFVGLPNAQAGVDDTICGSLVYNLNATPSAGTGTWTGPAGITFGTPNSPTSTATASAAGTYTLTWTEDNGGGCVSSDDVVITFSDPSFTETVTPALCGVSNGEIDMTASGGIGPYLYSIDNGVNTQASGLFTGLPTNNYDGWIQDAAGCQFTNNISVPNAGSPFIDSVVTTDPLCNGDCNGQLIIYASGGTPPYSYSLDGTTFTPGQDTWTGLCAGNQPVWIEDASGCQNTDAGLLNDPDLLTHSVVITDLQCAGDGSGQIDITANGGTVTGNYTYSIDDGTGPITQTNGLFTGLAGGTYTVTVTDDNGCSSTSSEDVNEPAPLTLTFSTFDASCAGLCDGSAIVIPAGGTAASGYTYTWSAGIAGNVPNASSVCPGTYDLTVTDDNGCTADTLGWQIIGPPAVTFSSVTFTDETCNLACDGTIDVASAAATEYSIDGGPFGPTTSFIGLCAGPHTVTAQDANGCSVDTTVTIGSPPPVTLSVSPDTIICIGGTATLTANAAGGVGGFNYNWDSGDLTATINVSPGGTTVYCVTVTDANGCPAPAPACVNVGVNPPLQVLALSDQSICPGDAANISALANGGDGNYTYTWDNALGTGQLQTVSPATTTTYTVTASDGCETPDATASVTITVNPLPTVDFAPDVTDGCVPLTVNFTEVGQPAGSQCFWDFGDANADVNCGTVTNTYTAPGCYDVTLTVVSDLGCTDQITYPSLVCAHPYPVAAFTFGPQPTSVLNPNITFSNQSIGATSYNWDFGTDGALGTSTDTNPTFAFPADAPGTYEVCLLATNDFGCQDSVCDLVVIDEEFIVYVPNAFTPDADNVNETFAPVVTGADPLQYTFRIFDRWGLLIYETQHIGQGWDGTYKNQIVQQDVYVWQLQIVNAMNNQKHEYKGHVTLLK